MNKLAIEVLIIKIPMRIKRVERETEHAEGEHETAEGHIWILYIHFILPFALKLFLINNKFMFKIWVSFEEGLSILLISLCNMVILRPLVLSIDFRRLLRSENLNQRPLIIVNFSTMFVRFYKMQNRPFRSINFKELGYSMCNMTLIFVQRHNIMLIRQH